MTDDRPIGVFDSGAGGISVLRELMRQMPNERFAYFGDSLNTPYGDKPEEWVKDRCDRVVRLLVEGLGAKAVVIACNTATAAASDFLRREHPGVPIFGIEPALKPAATENLGGTVLVMGTEMTLRLDRYRLLVDRWGTGCAVVSVPCPGLADAVEAGKAGTDEMRELVSSLIGNWRGYADAVVLGCTHYPFAEREIRDALGDDIGIYDGAEGTARHVRTTLFGKGMLAGRTDWGEYDDYPSSLLVGAEKPVHIVPNVWNLPDKRVLMMTSGTIPHIILYEVLLQQGRIPEMKQGHDGKGIASASI